MLDRSVTVKIEDFSEKLQKQIDELRLMDFSQRFKLWRENRYLFGINNLEEITANEQALSIRTEVIEFIRKLLRTDEDVLIDLLEAGYPSIDTVGLLPLVDIVSMHYFNIDSYGVSQDLDFLKPYLTINRLISMDVLYSFIKKTLDPNERLVALEYGIGDFTDLISKVRLPGIFLTDKRLIVAGNDVAYRGTGTAANIMLFPGVRTSFNIPYPNQYIRLYYPDYTEHQYYGSLDYISFDQIDAVKEKNESIEIALDKKFRILSLTDKGPYNRHLKNINGEMAKPLFGRKMRVYLVSDKGVDNKMNKSRRQILKSSIEQVVKESKK